MGCDPVRRQERKIQMNAELFHNHMYLISYVTKSKQSQIAIEAPIPVASSLVPDLKLLTSALPTSNSELEVATNHVQHANSEAGDESLIRHQTCNT